MQNMQGDARGDAKFHVLAIGNAIVDVLARVDDDFLVARGLHKGTMSLVDAEVAQQSYQGLSDQGASPQRECCGGSAANTIAALASLGNQCAFIGKVRDDALGDVFRRDMQSLGIAFDTPAANRSPPTAQCLVLITPDGQRTMQTFLGASAGLTSADVDATQVKESAVLYMEGYLWDSPGAREAYIKASDIAHQAGRHVALSLSDPFCVERHRESFLDLVLHHIDILFANELEIMSLYQSATFDDALQAVRPCVQVAALTRSSKGSVILSGDEVHIVDAHPLEKVVDSTGAGDVYAAGFLHGLNRSVDLAGCARLGGIVATEVISHIGARAERPLAEVVRVSTE